MEITFEKHEDYYLFSDSPETKVYLGEVSPEDYIHDQIHQAKRSASCHHYSLETGEKVSQETAYNDEGMIWHGPSFEGDTPERQNCKYGYKCDYDFERKTSLAMMGSPRGNFKYNSKDPAMKRLAEAQFFDDGDLEAYDARQEEFRLDREKSEREKPSIANLMMVGGKPPYYVDDDGDEITPEEHIARMKAKHGDDVFEKEAEKLDRETSPEVKQIVAEIMEQRKAV